MQYSYDFTIQHPHKMKYHIHIFIILCLHVHTFTSVFHYNYWYKSFQKCWMATSTFAPSKYITLKTCYYIVSFKIYGLVKRVSYAPWLCDVPVTKAK
jgi:hypothetical protein